MSREQWGHGFHAGRTSRGRRGYVGMWFFTCNGGGHIEFQGEIRRKVGKEQYAVQRHSWLDGAANGPLVVVGLADLAQWRLFETAAALRRGVFDYRQLRPDLYPEAIGAKFEWQEQFLRGLFGISDDESKE